mgnify:CR=1 FL=1
MQKRPPGDPKQCLKPLCCLKPCLGRVATQDLRSSIARAGRVRDHGGGLAAMVARLGATRCSASRNARNVRGGAALFGRLRQEPIGELQLGPHVLHLCRREGFSAGLKQSQVRCDGDVDFARAFEELLLSRP